MLQNMGRCSRPSTVENMHLLSSSAHRLLCSTLPKLFPAFFLFSSWSVGSGPRKGESNVLHTLSWSFLGEYGKVTTTTFLRRYTHSLFLGS